MKERDDLINESKDIIVEIIRNFNSIESDIKELIVSFTDAKEEFFLREIVLNNMIVNFSSKKRILIYIVKNEKYLTDSEIINLNKSLNIMMNKRNLIAHSDSAFVPEFHFEYNESNFYNDQNKLKLKFSTPKLKTINDGQIESFEINKVHKDFIKHFNITCEILEKIASKINN